MAEAQQLLPSDINDDLEPEDDENTSERKTIPGDSHKWWLQTAICIMLVLTGQATVSVLGKVYFNNGGRSQWMAAFVQVVGFPILFPLRWIITTTNSIITQPNPLTLALIYISSGMFLVADCLLGTIGLRFLPVTTYTLIFASQLGFNALFSYLLNGQKFTPYIVNSIVLLTISSVLLVFQNENVESGKTSNSEYAIGFACALASSASEALLLSAMQFCFDKIIKRETSSAVIDMTIYQNLVASIVIVIMIFVSGDWKKLKGEMVGYKLGEVSYLMNLIGLAIMWQAYSVGSIGLIFQVSSLFSNAIAVVGQPLAPIVAVVVLGESLSGLKLVSMVVAICGLVSYMYQHYIDDYSAPLPLLANHS